LRVNQGVGFVLERIGVARRAPAAPNMAQIWRSPAAHRRYG
jgi:hypothetical protein